MVAWSANSTEPALLGRQYELAVLHEELARAQAGHLRVTLVGGEPGIGKTRLLVDANSEYSYAGCDFRTGSDRHIRVSGISVFLG